MTSELILILNDQGGAQMSVSLDTASTLRAEMKHHEPIVLLRLLSDEKERDFQCNR